MSIIKYFILLLCVFSFCSIHSQIEITKKIDSIIDIYDSNKAPGLSIKVINQGKNIYSRGVGLSNLDYSIKNSDSTVFSLASIAKQFTASAIWVLIKEDKISLEDDIRIYLPEFPIYENVIKIKHLLNHTSGIRNYHTLMYLSGFDYDNVYYDNDTVFKLACKQRGLNSIPGKKVGYSNTNYNLLAIIIERISGKNLDVFLKSKILRPLNMQSTFVRIEHGNPIKNRAIGYKKQGDVFKFSVNNQISYGAGSMGSTLNDMTIWIQMLNEDIIAFKPLAKFLKTTEVLITGESAKYARGIMIDDYKGYETASHGGYGFGGRTQLVTITEKGIGIIILTNLQSIDAPRISYNVLDILLSNSVEKINRPAVETSFKKQDLNKFVGEYKETHSDMTMRLFIENDTLKSIGSMGQTVAALGQYDNNKFHRIQSQNVKYNFSESKDHDMVISFGGTPFYFKRAQFVQADAVNISDFVGNYHSEELDVTYSFFVKNETLQVSYKGNENVSLKPIQLNEFGNSDRTLYHFTTKSNGEISGMLLSCDSAVKEIIFKKEEDY